jgi:N-acetylglucosaminyldiphosphoundecaprenol N-acetyl-beta-D-mannosaminyltransferase
MSLVLHIDDYDLSQFSAIARDFGAARFGYVVTANVDHLIRYHDDAQFRELYSHASFILLDSRFLSYWLAVTRGRRFQVCPGSDLTVNILENVLQPQDAVVLVGASAAQASQLRTRYGLQNLTHIDPPMGFVRDPAAVEDCLRQIETASPFRFCFLAVGSPQQEMLARMLGERGVARGLGLCIGASVNFVTEAERRAPRWLQRIGMEWSFRLMQDPRRMARRYLIRGPRIFRLLSSFDLRARGDATTGAEQ